MGSSSESVRVYINGDEYPIKGDVDVETTKLVAEYVDHKMAEYQKSIASRDKVKTAVLSALNIAGELFDWKRKCEAAEKRLNDMQEKTSSMAERIEKVLPH